MSNRDSSSKAPSQRQLRVGEELRHVVSGLLFRNELHDPDLERLSITVSEVRISPDLKNATAYVTPLAGGQDGDKIVEKLNQLAPSLRRLLGKNLTLRYVPKLYFKLDRSFEAAGRVNALLSSDAVRRDVIKPEDSE